MTNELWKGAFLTLRWYINLLGSAVIITTFIKRLPNWILGPDRIFYSSSDINIALDVAFFIVSIIMIIINFGYYWQKQIEKRK
jgi:hypothetical protein